MKLRFLTATFLVITACCSAQTRRIAFESHSGNPQHFQLAISNDLFDGDESDFGLPPEKEVKTYKLDSVIYVSDSVSVLVKKEYSRPFNEPKTAAKYVQTVKDTICNDPLYSNKHGLDQIREQLKKDSFYINWNNLNKVIFVGYDNKKTSKPKSEQIPMIVTPGNPGNNSPFDGRIFMIVGLIFTLSLLGGWISWKFYQPALQGDKR
jgi:hypothetical protein